MHEFTQHILQSSRLVSHASHLTAHLLLKVLHLHQLTPWFVDRRSSITVSRDANVMSDFDDCGTMLLYVSMVMSQTWVGVCEA